MSRSVQLALLLWCIDLCLGVHRARAEDVQQHQITSQVDNSDALRSSCYDQIRSALYARLYTLKRNLSIYHWFWNQRYNGEDALNPTSPEFAIRVRAMTVAKTKRFAQTNESFAVGGGMYFAMDPVSSMEHSGSGRDKPGRDGMVVKMDLPPGTRVVRASLSDHLQTPELMGYVLPLGDNCPPLKNLNLSKPQQEVRADYNRVMRDLNVAAIVYPYEAERYDSPSRPDGIANPNMGPDRSLAINVIDSAMAERVSLSAYTAAQILDSKSSLNEALFNRYFDIFRRKKKAEVSANFKAWADSNLLPLQGFGAFFEKAP